MILQATVISRWIFSHFLGRYEIVAKRRVICMDHCEQKRVNLSELLRFTSRCDCNRKRFAVEVNEA